MAAGPNRRRYVSPVTLAPARPQVPRVIFWPAVRATVWFVVRVVALLVLLAVYVKRVAGGGGGGGSLLHSRALVATAQKASRAGRT